MYLLDNTFRQKGIVQTMSSAYTLVFHRIAERNNHTQLQRARALSLELGLSPTFGVRQIHMHVV